MNKFFTLLTVTLLPFSLCGMENKSEYNNSALHWALGLYQGDAQNIDDLLEKGFDANAYDAYGARKHTPLALLVGRFQFVNNMKTNSPDLWPPKSEPNLESFERVTKSLLEHGADINKKQVAYDSDKKDYVETSNYNLLKPHIPHLDGIIEKVEIKKKQKNIATDLKVAFEENKQASHSIVINGREFKLNKEILSARCPKLLEFN